MILEPIPFPKIPKVTRHRLERKRDQFNPTPCQHNHMLLPHGTKVECADCHAEIDPMEALHIIASRMWWKYNAEEMKIEQEAKRVSRVQKAAVEHLHSRGITPEKYREMCEKLEIENKRSA